MIKQLFILLTIALFLPVTVCGQISEQYLTEINDERLQVNRTGMKVLASWAVGNIAAGAWGRATSTGSLQSFHEMNLAWNGVNLAIAGFGYFGSLDNPARIGLRETLKEYRNFENLLLFNAGLDLGYIAFGAYLWERGIRTDSSRSTGYGQSLIMQGGFLFLFDLILYRAVRSKHNTLLKHIDNITISMNTVGYRVRF